MEVELYKKAQSIVTALSSNGWSVATAESCTGGGIVAALTAVPGSSACVKGGIVAYTEEVKMHLLGVASHTLHDEGVVSEQTVGRGFVVVRSDNQKTIYTGFLGSGA